MPPELHDVLLDFEWDLERLWQLDLAANTISVGELAWHLRLPLWAFAGRPFAVSPAEVAADPRRFHEQYARTLAADLRYPLHVLDRPERLTLLDGVHRLLKADLLGHRTVTVKLVPMDMLDRFAVR